MMYGYYSEMSDSELWSLFLSGDKKALSYIYKNQYHQLLSYGIKLYPDYEVVRDCIQDLFVKLYLNHKKLSPTLNINAYLLRSLKNRLYDVLSDKKDISSLDETLAFDFTIDEEFFLQFPDNDDIDLQKKKKLHEIIHMLPSRQQEILYLRFVRELDYVEIGEILGINYQSTKNLLSRSLAKIRKVFFSDKK